MTTNEYLLERITELELELAETKCKFDELSEHHEETVYYFEKLNLEHDILSKYLKPDKHLIVAIIDGEDAETIAEMFRIRLSPNKE
jgi:hypothetical protein